MAKAGAIGRLAAKSLGRSRPRTVHTFHGHVLEGYFSPVVQRSFLAVERYLARSTDVLLVVSPEIRDELLALGIGRPSQYEVMPLGLELAAFHAVTEPTGRLRRAIGLDRDVPLVGVVGRLVPIKSVDQMVEAMTHLPGVHLAVVGDGDERPALVRVVRERGLEDRVHFTGWFDDIPSAMSDLDVVALSSRNEGTPVALIEALAAGRPVVATRVGGVEHVVIPDRTGLLVPPTDPEALARAVTSLLSDKELRERLGAAGRVHVRATFGADRLVEDMRALYRELVR
jgi:glycosyltransferase involved in cell wall biosynthesis